MGRNTLYTACGQREVSFFPYFSLKEEMSEGLSVGLRTVQSAKIEMSPFSCDSQFVRICVDSTNTIEMHSDAPEVGAAR